MQPEKFPERDRHEVPSLDAYRQRCPKEMLPETHYERMRRMGLEYGPMFQGIMEIHWGTREALVAISLPALLKGESHRYQIHPVLLDACFQSLAIAATGLKDGEEALENVSYLPIGFERIRFLDQPGTDIWCFAEIEDEAEWGAPTLKGDLTLLHSDGTWIGRIEGFEVARMDGDAKLRAEGVFYDLAWKHAEHALNERSQDPATWVIVKDRHGTGDRLAHLLGEKGDSVIQVAVGPDQTEVQAPEHGLSPDEPEQMKQTWQELLSLTEGKKTNVVYLMGLDYPGSHWTAENLEKAEREMTGCLLALIQTLIDQPGREARIWTVTVGAQSNGDSSPVSIAQSSLWGFSRTLSVAHPEWWGGLIDLDPASSHEERAQSILRETMLSDGEDQVMIRGSERYVARLVRKDLKPDTDSFEVRLDSSYLITGGLGELGLLFARWLVKRGARHLVLVGRTPLPPRSDWPSIQEGDRFYRQVRGVMELESMGAEVELAFFDVADEQKVRAYLSRHQREGKPPIRGILHLAGVVRNQSFSELDLEDLWSIYRPKVIGSWVLHQLFPAGTLDFFILFSSFTSMISPPRLAAYAGANAFMDALAKERSRLDQATISIAWGPWAEGGMAVRADGQGQVASDTTAGMKNMSPDEGLAAFEEIWRHPVPFIAVADVDWTEWSRWFAIASEAPLLRDLIRESADPVETAELPATSISQALAQTHSDERHSLIVQFLREQVADVMRFDVYQVAADQPLSQLGLDSMMAVELKNRIDRELRVTLPMVAFLSGPSIHELAEKVDRLIDDDHLEADSQVNLPRVETKEFPLSYGQRSLWFLHQVAPDSAAYHVGFAVKIESEMDDEAFRRAWTQVVRRQPSLRTTFKVEQGEPIQAVHDDVDVPLEEVDASAWDEPMLRERMDRDYRRPFDLSKGPIWRGVLYRKAASETVFLLVVHHIAIDFWGIEVLLDELRRFYEAEVSGKSADLAPLSAVYADFVQWQNRMLEGKEGKKQEAFWHKELAGELPDLQLPTDKPRPKQPSKKIFLAFMHRILKI